MIGLISTDAVYMMINSGIRIVGHLGCGGGGGGDQCATLHGLGGMESDRPRQQGAPSTSRSAGKSAQGLIWGHEQGM